MCACKVGVAISVARACNLKYVKIPLRWLDKDPITFTFLALDSSLPFVVQFVLCPAIRLFDSGLKGLLIS